MPKTNPLIPFNYDAMLSSESPSLIRETVEQMEADLDQAHCAERGKFTYEQMYEADEKLRALKKHLSSVNQQNSDALGRW